MKAGDVLVGQKAEDSWSVVKILAIDEWPDNSQVFHCMFYEPSPRRPTAKSVESLNVVAWHAPVAALLREDSLLRKMPPGQTYEMDDVRFRPGTDIKRG